MKKVNVMSLSLDTETEDKLKLHAKQKTNGNVSKLIRDMIDKYLIVEDNVIPVILKIPIDLKGDHDNLKKWLETKTQAVRQGTIMEKLENCTTGRNPKRGGMGWERFIENFSSWGYLLKSVCDREQGVGISAVQLGIPLNFFIAKTSPYVSIFRKL